MRNKTRFTSLGFLFAIILVCIQLAGCSGETSPSVSSQTGAEAKNPSGQVEVLRFGEGDSGYPTPWKRGRKGGGSRKVMLIYDSLLEKDSKGLVPWLAEKYEIQDNGKKYVFTLRENAKWHDGTALTAEDVKFTLEYIKKHPPVESPLDSADIVSINTVGDRVIEITVVQVATTLLEDIGSVLIVPKHVWENVDKPEEYVSDTATIGSGPYTLADYNSSQGTYKYEAFADFWGPTPAAKTLLWFPVSDHVLAFEAGEIDLARGVSVELRSKYEADPQYKVVFGPAFSGNRILFNFNSNPLLASKEFRQAVSYAVDTKELIEKLGRGVGEPSNAGLLPPHHIMYNPKVHQYDVDLKKSAELLAGLGYTQTDANGIRLNEKGEKLSFDLLASEKSLRPAELLREQLLRAGIEFNIKSMDTMVQESNVMEGKFDVAVVGHAGLGYDADYLRERYAMDISTGGASSVLASKGYKNQELIGLLNTQRTLTNFKERKAMLYKIQEILAEDVPEIMMYYNYDITVYKPATYDGWTHEFDERNYLAKLSYVLYSQWAAKQ